jgi:hypothetical protein
MLVSTCSSDAFSYDHLASSSCVRTASSARMMCDQTLCLLLQLLCVMPCALQNMRERQTNILTMQDIEDLGMDKVSSQSIINH